MISPLLAGAFQGALSGATDTFVTRLNAAGTGMIFSTYLGGSGNDLVEDIVIDQDMGDIRFGGKYTVGGFSYDIPAGIFW